MLSPTFTLIIPTYNRSDLLPRAIGSVINQREQDWELIVVDDGSTDATEEVVRGYTDDRIRYVHQRNQQASAARNTGMQHARGRYFGFLDDDDELAPNHLEALRAGMVSTKYAYSVYRSGEINRGPRGDKPQPNYRNGEDSLRQYWSSPGGQFGMVFRRGEIDRYRFDPNKLLLEDFSWINRVLLEHELYQVDAHTAIVNLHPGRRSATYLNDKLFDQNLDTLAASYHLPGVIDRVPFDYYRKLMLHQYMHYTRKLARTGYILKAMRTYKTGLSYATTKESKELVWTLAKLFR